MATPPFKVKALYEYSSEHEDDLNFAVGQIVTVTELEGDDWYVGEYNDASGAKKEGLFPANFVEKHEPEVPVRPTRPSRPKQEVQPAPQPTPVSEPAEPEPEDEEDDDEMVEEAPQIPTLSKPTAAPVAPVSYEKSQGKPLSPQSASISRSPVTQEQAEAPLAPKPPPAEPSESVKKPPPPVAPKSNAFKDRIAAFNQPAAAPIAPMQPGRKFQSNDFIKKPFVAPPPSKNAYVPPPKSETVQKPYHRDEDPEIQQRQEADRAAAEAAGLAGENPAAQQNNEDEDTPKPLTLKERMALLQKQQQEQAERRAETTQKKKPPVKKPSESSETTAVPAGEEAEAHTLHEEASAKQSFEASRERPQVPPIPRIPVDPTPAEPEHEMLSDGHEADQSGAGDLTEDSTGTLGPDDSDDRPISAQRHPAAPSAEPDVGDEDDTTERDDDGAEDSMDEEERRKQELRARMARLGGAQPGMGAMLFGGPQPPPPPKKRSSGREKTAADETEQGTPIETQQRIPMIPVPGIPRMQSPESDATRRTSGDGGMEAMDQAEAPPAPKRMSTMERAPPPPVPKESRPVPQAPVERGVPPPESRPVPPPPAGSAMSPGPGSESDDEMSTHAKKSSTETSGIETTLPIRPGPPPIPGPRDLPQRPGEPPENKRSSYIAGSELPITTSDKRLSRAPPPVPGSPPTSSRPPPPPPPAQAPPTRQSTANTQLILNDEERIGSDYDGDYDTDIGSSAKHKDALKAPHVRDSSLTDEAELADQTPQPTPVPTAASASAPRSVPPPPPQGPPKSRPSMDRPPPPVPVAASEAHEGDYDPFKYTESRHGAVPPVPESAPLAAPTGPLVQEPEALENESSADEMYDEPLPPVRRSTDRAPPPPPHASSGPPTSGLVQPASRTPKQSLDISRSGTIGRRSMEQGRPSTDLGQIARDIELDSTTPWWTAAEPLPPSLQSRNGVDLLSESEESSKAKRGGRKEITKDVYILFMDYSQTVIAVRYDSQDPSDVHFEQRHEAPPAKLRQDQLEAAWHRFGKSISDTASSHGNSKKESIVDDGTPISLPLSLIKAQPGALLPVGTRAYGALVYANLANASTMQFDEIRPGDIITLRNAKFEGHHGAMKTKYRVDYGVAHVAVVDEWDGTRRAIRAWEQGREKKGGVRHEKFRLGDLRSGEVRVWRVVGRDWVGWDQE